MDMELDLDEELLEFELESFSSPSANPKKRKKVIDLDDLLKDCKKEEEERQKSKSKAVRVHKHLIIRDDEDKTEQKLSEAVDDLHEMIKDLDGKDNVSNGFEIKEGNRDWGLQVFGPEKLPSPLAFPALGHSMLLQTFMSSELNSLVEFDMDKVEVFLKGLLLNGWLGNLALKCGHLEESIAIWSFNLLLYSSEESLRLAACDFWHTILLANEGDDLQIKIQWRPSYSQLKTALESFGFLFHFPGNPSSDKELIDSDSSNQGPPSNLTTWIKFVTACCQARNKHSMISTSQAEELLGSVVFMHIDRRLEGLSVALHECLQSCINFFEEEEWCASCERVANFLAGSQYWPRSSKGESSSKTNASGEAIISGLKDQIQVIQSTLGSKIKALENIIEKMLTDKAAVGEGHPLKVGDAMTTPAHEVPCPQSGKASCSALKNATAETELEWRSCDLFWPDLKQAVAKGKLYSSSNGGGVLHNRPLESGRVRVEVSTLLKGDAKVPYPTDEVHLVRDAIGQFIAWPELLAIPIETRVLDPAEMEKSKEKVKGKSLTYESVVGPSESESEASNLEKYHWILDEFNGDKVRQIKVSMEIFHYKHPGLDIGKEEIQRLIDGKEIGASHVMLYIRYLFDNHCKGVKDMFKFICPTQVSPLGQSVERRAVYVASCMEGNVNDMIFVAPYHFRYHWVLILMIPHLGCAYWIDPRHGNVEKDAELLTTL